MWKYKIEFFDRKYPGKHFPTELIEITVQADNEDYVLQVVALLTRSLFDDSKGTVIQKLTQVKEEKLS